MRTFLIALVILLLPVLAPAAEMPVANGYASWYGEELRGRLMANGEAFDPDNLTAASWFYPLGATVRVTLRSAPDSLHAGEEERSVLVTITDRGPAKRLVRAGRVIDLGRAAFEKLAPPKRGLIPVSIRAVP